MGDFPRFYRSPIRPHTKGLEPRRVWPPGAGSYRIRENRVIGSYGSKVRLRERVMHMVRGPETTAGPQGDGADEVTAGELAGHRFFEGMPRWALERLARSATKRSLEERRVGNECRYRWSPYHY